MTEGNHGMSWSSPAAAVLILLASGAFGAMLNSVAAGVFMAAVLTLWKVVR